MKPPLIADSRFEAYRRGSAGSAFIRDAMAGLIVALVAIPLGVGFSIASGMRPEQGIIAGATAGILGGIFGGSKYQVYGPTAAFIPLISGIVARYDVPFMILSAVIAGTLVFLMGIFRLGEWFNKVPFSITVGFTIGIAATIALGQVPDVVGSLHPLVPHAIDKIRLVPELLAQVNGIALLFALATFFIIRWCYKTSVFIPGPLIAIVLGILALQFLLPQGAVPIVSDKYGHIGSDLFKITLPALGPHHWTDLIAPVLSIMFIASLESLLSARMADRLAHSKTHYNPNRELMGQGIVNMMVPLLNGFPCTGAFARTATSIKAGAVSPVASLCKGSFVIILMLFFAQYVALMPMACVGGLLVYVAKNMVKPEEVSHAWGEGRLHAFLMCYTALMTFLTDLFIAVSTATAIYAMSRYFRTKKPGAIRHGS